MSSPRLILLTVLWTLTIEAWAALVLVAIGDGSTESWAMGGMMIVLPVGAALIVWTGLLVGLTLWLNIIAGE